MQHVTRILSRLVSKPNDGLFDGIVSEFISYVDRPVHSLQEMRDNRSTKMKGDLFEAFCVLYLQRKGYTVWLLKETPADILAHIGLGTFDVGIDLIARKNGRFSAVQCKFKRPRAGFVKGTWLPYNCVNWKEVSTFYSLCHRTQEKAQWQHHIVMTNCKYVRRMGNATPYDKTFAYGSFSKLSVIETIDMIKNVVKEDSEDVKKDNEDFKKDSEDVKKDNEDVKKDSEDVKKGNEDVKKYSEDVKKGNEDVKKDNEDVKKDNEDVKEEKEIKKVKKAKKVKEELSEKEVEKVEKVKEVKKKNTKKSKPQQQNSLSVEDIRKARLVFFDKI